MLLLSLAEQVSYCKLRLASCGIASVPPPRHQHLWCFHLYGLGLGLVRAGRVQ